MALAEFARWHPLAGPPDHRTTGPPDHRYGAGHGALGGLLWAVRQPVNPPGFIFGVPL